MTQDKSEKSKQAWLQSLLKNMENQLPEEACIQLMEATGRDCARRSAIAMARSCMGDLAVFAGKMKKYAAVSLEGGTIQLSYPKCYCPIVGKLDNLPDVWCRCSVGWVKEMFGTVAGKLVEVELLQSIKRGDPVCQFTVHIS